MFLQTNSPINTHTHSQSKESPSVLTWPFSCFYLFFHGPRSFSQLHYVFSRLLDAGWGLWVWVGCGLPWHSVHGPQELICNSSCLPQPAQQSAVDRSGIVPDRVFAPEEQTWNRLCERHNIKKKHKWYTKIIITYSLVWTFFLPVKLQVWQDQVWWAGPWDHSHYQTIRLLRTSKIPEPRGRHASESPPSLLAAMTTDTEHTFSLLSLKDSQTPQSTRMSCTVCVCEFTWVCVVTFLL